MRSKALVVLVFVGVGILASCENEPQIQNLVSGPHPAIENTVLTAKLADGESMVSPIEKNYTNETPPRYLMNHKFGNAGIEVGCQYIGRGVVDRMSKVDVYMISLKIGDGPVEHQAVVYEGGRMVIVERPQIEITLNQDPSSD